MTVQTADAAHPYRPTCLTDTGCEAGVAAAILEAVQCGRCPRCLQTALPQNPPGSRATRCRCIPLCRDCAVEEVNVETYRDPGEWPLPSTVRAERSEIRQRAREILDDMDGHKARGPRYGKGDAALDAIAVIEAVRTNDAGTVAALWDTFEPMQSRQVAAILAGWVVTAIDLTALAFDDWIAQVRTAALHIRDTDEHDR